MFLYLENMDKFKTSLRSFVQTEKSSLPDDYNRGYIDAIIRAQTKEEGNYFTDEQLITSVEDFFTGTVLVYIIGTNTGQKK